MSDDLVSQELHKRISQLQLLMGNGICKDYVDYQNVVGQIKGLEYSLEIISDLKKKFEEQDNKT